MSTDPRVGVFSTLALPVATTLHHAADAARWLVAHPTDSATDTAPGAAASDAAAASFTRPQAMSAMTHAWLFTGPPGSGRSIAALSFAAALVCTNPTSAGCGECQACRNVFAGTHADVLHYVPQELSIKVSEVRRATMEADKMPTTANWRVIIFEDSDRLTEGAANALLKTVEEPPARTVIILCAPSTDPMDISVTLRSRCRHIYVPTPDTETVANLLITRAQERGETVNPEHARLAASASAGHVGRAKHLLHNPEAQARRAHVLNIAGLIERGPAAFVAADELVAMVEKEAETALAEKEAVELEKLQNSLGQGAKGKGVARAIGGASEIKELEKTQKKRRTRFIRDAIDLSLVDLAALFRDAIMLQSGTTAASIHPDFHSLSSYLADTLSLAGLVACIEATTTARTQISVNVRTQTALDAMIGRMRLNYAHSRRT